MNDFGQFTTVLGSSGTGKTSCFLMPEVKSVIQKGQSFVLTDSKNEAFGFIGKDLKENGYNVVTINFRDNSRSDLWNPLWLPYDYFVNKDSEKCYHLLNEIAGLIFNQGKKVDTDPFWDISARDLFVGLSFALFEDAKSRKEINLLSVYMMAMTINERVGGVSGSTYLQKYLETKKDKVGYAFSCMYGTINSPSDTKSSIMAVFFQKMRSLIVNEKYSAILCNNTVDLVDALQKKTAFIIQYEDEIVESSFAAKVFVHQIINLLIEERTIGDKIHNCFHVFFEDFLLLNYYSNIDSLILGAKERGINLFFCINSISLLENVYGKNISNALLENSEHIVFTSFGSKEILEYINNWVEGEWRLHEISGEKALVLYNHSGKSIEVKKYLSRTKYDISDFVVTHQKEKIEIFSIAEIVNAKVEEDCQIMLNHFQRKENSLDILIRDIDKRIEQLEREEQEE